MNNIYKYDRTMGYSSVYILIPAYYASTPANIIMILQTIFSVLHWKNYTNLFFHYTDISLSVYIFAYHLFLLQSIEIYYRKISMIFAILTVVVFYNRKGYRESALMKYKIIHVIPHTMFRFFAFWFVMTIYNKDFSILLSLFYWLNVFGLAYFS